MAQQKGPQSFMGGDGLALGNTINPLSSPTFSTTQGYKCYSAVLTAGVSPLIINVGAALGYPATKYMIANTSATTSTVYNIQYSYDGVTYGDSIPVSTSIIWNYDTGGIPVNYFKLTRVSADATYVIQAM